MIGYPLQYALSFIGVGLLSMFLAARVSFAPGRAVLGCAAFAFLAVGLAYLAASPRLFMKSRAGRRHPLSRVLLWPFDALNILIFNVYHRLSGAPPYVEILPGLFLGRRLWKREASAFGACSVLDVTCEFDENPSMRGGDGYHCLPVLDNTCPTGGQLREGVHWLSDALKKGRVYVHCAAGHGRSATVLVAYLLATGVVSEIEEGIAFLKVRRPGVRLNACQRAALRTFMKTDQAITSEPIEEAKS